MRTLARKIPAILIPAAAVLIGGCGAGDSGSASDERIPVVVEDVRREDLRVVRTYTGGVEGIRQATLSARISESVTEIHVDEGDRVAAGDAIISFDEGGPTSALHQARAVYEDAKRNAAKFNRLYDQGAVSEVERNARQTAADVAEADYQSALERARLVAPISGICTDLSTHVGKRETAGTAVAIIAAIDTVRVLVDVSVYESGDFHKGQPVVVRSELDPTLSATGWVSAISASADASTRTQSLEILVPNPGGRLMPGLFVRAEIEIETRSQVITVPRDALVYRETTLGVFAAVDSVAHYRPITIGVEANGLVEVRDGLQESDRVVVLGQGNLQEGTLIDPVDESRAQTGAAQP